MPFCQQPGRGLQSAQPRYPPAPATFSGAQRPGGGRRLPCNPIPTRSPASQPGRAAHPTPAQAFLRPSVAPTAPIARPGRRGTPGFGGLTGQLPAGSSTGGALGMYTPPWLGGRPLYGGGTSPGPKPNSDGSVLAAYLASGSRAFGTGLAVVVRRAMVRGRSWLGRNRRRGGICAARSDLADDCSATVPSAYAEAACKEAVLQRVPC